MALDETPELALLREIARWTREAALPNVRQRVDRLVDTDAKRRAYAAMAEGIASMKLIESLSGANHADVRSWLRVWEAEGIAEPDASPPKATFTLRELGIPPAPPKGERTRKSGEK